jgi:proton-translocating NADH-quinone oxidoreductase chain N
MNLPSFVWLIALLLLSAPLVFLAGRISRQPAWSRRTALAVLAAAWLPFALAAGDVNVRAVSVYSFGAVEMRFDALSLIFVGLVLTLGLLVSLTSGPSQHGDAGEETYFALLNAMLGVLVALASAADLFNLWVWFEALAVTSYLLVAFHREEPASLEAGVKYLVQSATGSLLVLLGIALVLAERGTLNLDHIRGGPSDSFLFTAMLALFVIGFGVKAALVPLHTWLPDAHAQAPSGISAMLSGVVLEAGLLVLIRTVTALVPLGQAEGKLGILLMGFGALNLLVGNLLALRQSQLKRMLAYSTVAQVGYMMIGFGVAAYAQQVEGAQGALFHLFNHGLMKGLAFLAAGTLLYALHTSAGTVGAPLLIPDLSGAARRYPLVALTLSVALLGLGGLPPLAGFMSKWQIIAAGFETNNPVIDGLMVFAALNSVLSLAYYTPVVNTLYRQLPSVAVQHGRGVPRIMSLPLAVMALAVLVIGVWPVLLSGLTAPAGAAILAAFGR